VIELPADLEWLGWAWSFAVGAVVGSFLNVVIARVPAGESIVHPASRCPKCHAPIAWHDNVPILSWIALRGRCRSCGAGISVRYPLVELLGGLAALAAFSRHGLSLAGLAELGFVDALLALSLIDLDVWLLPHAITIPLLGAGVALSAAHLTAAPSLTSSLLGAGAGWLAFASVSFLGERILRREALGFGDVWLLSGIAAWLGVKSILPVVLLASIQGTVVGLTLIALGKSEPGPAPEAGPEAPVATPEPPAPGTEQADASADEWVPPRHAVPFGPFLAAGALEWLFLQAWLATLLPALGLFR